MRACYFDCIGGASGDMILGALIDAGLPLKTLTSELAKLPLTGYQISTQKVRRGSITATQVTVNVRKPAAKDLRHLGSILQIIKESSLPKEAKSKGAAIFRRLAEAESQVHNIPLTEVHFHELGAVDTIVDIMGAVLGLRLLGIDSVFSSPLPSGRGLVSSSHGPLPIPAPATLKLIAMAKAPIRAAVSPEAELVTPTGAAILTKMATFGEPTIHLERVGYGAGSRDLPTLPNLLCVWIGESHSPQEKKDLLLLETNIDDMIPELYGHVMERLFELGAKDVWFTPIQMKKNRPAVMLSVLASPEAEAKIVESILKETSTLGVRVRAVKRHESGREVLEFKSSLGKVAVKAKRMGNVYIGVAPEYEDCRRIALEKDMPLQDVYRIVASEAGRKFLRKHHK